MHISHQRGCFDPVRCWIKLSALSAGLIGAARSRFETLWEGVTIAYFPTFSIPLPTGTAPLVVFAVLLAQVLALVVEKSL